MRMSAIVAVLFLLAGCSWFRAHVYVEDRVIHVAGPTQQYLAAQVQLLREDPNQPRTGRPRNQAHDSIIMAGLEDELFDEDNFVRGDGLRMAVQVFRSDEGERAARAYTPTRVSGIGAGRITARVGFYNEAGKLMREVQFKGEISGGFFGGDFELALLRTGEEIAEYAVDEFLAPR